MDPRSVLFHRQDGSWDCGEACARSALAWYRAAAPLELDSGILDASATTTVQIIRSIFRSLFSFVANISSLHLPNGTEGPISDGPWWSIDIMAWLRNRGVPCILSTAFAGIHSVHWEDSWYLETLASDKVRVEMLFDRARKEAWPIIAAPVARCETIHEEADDSNPLLKLEDLLSLVESDCLAIVLVDSILLNGTSTGAIAARFSNQCTETSPPEDHRCVYVISLESTCCSLTRCGDDGQAIHRPLRAVAGPRPKCLVLREPRAAFRPLVRPRRR